MKKDMGKGKETGIMAKDDRAILEKASTLLDAEGYKGVYDGEQARRFWKASVYICEALALLEMVDRS